MQGRCAVAPADTGQHRCRQAWPGVDCSRCRVRCVSVTLGVARMPGSRPLTLRQRRGDLQGGASRLRLQPALDELHGTGQQACCHARARAGHELVAHGELCACGPHPGCVRQTGRFTGKCIKPRSSLDPTLYVCSIGARPSGALSHAASAAHAHHQRAGASAPSGPAWRI